MSSLNISGSSNGHIESAENHEVQSQASDMQQRARLLLDELVQFRLHLKERKREDVANLVGIQTDVQNELKLLEKVGRASWLKRSNLTGKQLSSTDTTDEKIMHTLRSANLTFFEHLVSMPGNNYFLSPGYCTSSRFL